MSQNIPDIEEMYKFYVDRYNVYKNLGFEDVQCSDFALSAVINKHSIPNTHDNKVLLLSEFHAMNCVNLFKKFTRN